MCKRVLADWRSLLWAAVAASLVLAPVADVAAGSKDLPAAVGRDQGAISLKKPDDELGRRRVLFARTTYVWPFATGPVYGERQVPPGQWRKPGMLHTSVGHFDLTRGVPNFPPELMTSVRLDLAAQYFLLQVHPDTFGDGTFDEIRAWVEGHGGTFVQSIPVAAFIVRLQPSAFGELQAQPGVLALLPYHPAFKLSPQIGRLPLPDPARAASEIYRLRARLFPGEDAQMVAQAIARLGGNIVAVWPDTVIAELHRDKLAQLAALEPVSFITEDVPALLTGEETTTTMQTGRYNAGAIPYHDAGVTGGGAGISPEGAQVLMVLDNGIQVDAGDLSHTKTDSGWDDVASEVIPGHRKVLHYGVTDDFGASPGGDFLGCDATINGGFTHGHVVSATALGWATDVDTDYDPNGEGWLAFDEDGNPWKLDGVAPLAKLVFYDAQETPGALSCDDPSAAGLSVGDLYTAPSDGSMADAYNRGARTFSFSFGSSAGVYGDAADVDAFMFDHSDALVFVSAGNAASDTNNDGIPDPGSITDPATCKNCISVGASGNANDTVPGGGGPNDRAGFSSVGPATSASNRVAPTLMAPGTDFGGLGNMGLDSEFSCRTNDNDQNVPVECDVVSGLSGTSFAAPAAAGAAMLVRDYFMQGFYPDGTSSDAGNGGDIPTNVSGALVKAVLIASAEFMTGLNLTEGFRFNNEQGYGRIQLDNVLPLATWSASPTGLIVADGGVTGGPNNTTLDGSATQGGTDSYTFRVDDNTQELRIACAWVEDAGDTMTNDIDIELCESDDQGNCTGKTYIGNFFSEDVNRNDVLDGDENCIDGFDPENPAPNEVDEGAWSIPTNNCATNPNRVDTTNPTEAIMLSPDPQGDGIEDKDDTPGVNEGDDNQITPGFYTLRVIGSNIVGGQPYACVIAGPVALGSSVRFNKATFVCNDLATITVNEVEPGDDGDTDLQNCDTDPDPVGCRESLVSSRVTVQVLDASDNVVDEETGLPFTQPDPAALKFVAADIALTDGTTRDPSATFNNGVFDIRPGERLKVVYDDVTEDPFNTAVANCNAKIAFGGINFAMFGMNSSVFIDGGCERDARGKFTFGFPDQFMDAGETIGYLLAFQSTEPTDTLEDVEVSLRCVVADSDSPADCLPGTQDCADPNRENNSDCSGLLTILDPVKTIGELPPAVPLSVNFTVEVADTITGTPEIEMLAEITARKSGKSGTTLVVSRHTLDVDEKMLFYSTDFPNGGVEIIDWDNSETFNPTSCTLNTPCTEGQRGEPTTSLDFLDDYRFEQIQWSDLTNPIDGSGPKNSGINPWDFDVNDEGFTVGLHTATDLSLVNSVTVANWGEDTNFNGILESTPDVPFPEDRDPANGALDNNWSTQGGCGWQTPQGVWHTGTIGKTTGGQCSNRCELYDTAGAALGPSGLPENRFWWELLKTPVVQQVNDTYRVEILGLDWNTEMDLADDWAAFTWALDTNTEALEPVNLDANILNFVFGPHGAVTGGNSPLTDGFMLFAPMAVCSGTTVVCASNQDCVDLFGAGSSCDTSGTTTVNGSVGNNRVGQNSCFFEQASAIELPHALAKPWDDDQDNDSDTQVDEHVEPNGPRRNFHLQLANGPDMRFFTLEDIYGPSGPTFQAAFGFLTIEGTPNQDEPVAGYGVAIDDVVLYWREITEDKDQTDCSPAAGGGACASIEFQQLNIFEGQTRLQVRVADLFPYDPSGQNDCDCDGTFGEAGEDQNCDDDPSNTPDITVLLTTESGDQECLVLNLADPDGTHPGGVYEGEIILSSAYDADGVLFLEASGEDNPTVTARYTDLNDGTGAKCPNDVNPDVEGTVFASTTVFLNRALLIVSQPNITGGDGDPWPDTGETLDLYVTVENRSGVDLDGVFLRLSTNDPEIECIVQPVVSVGPILDGETKTNVGPFTFKVRNDVNRSDNPPANPDYDFVATFTVGMSAVGWDANIIPQQLVFDLDFDATGADTGHTTHSFTFESGSLGPDFTTNDIDAGKSSLPLSDGYRCQYNDPDNPNSNSYGNEDCFLGFGNPIQDGYDWHVHSGRAHSGTFSAHWGIDDAEITTRLKQLEAIETTDSFLLGWETVGGDTADPKLEFWHQVDLVDFRTTNTPDGQSIDRAVVMVQVDGAGDWIKIYPFENIYDIQATDVFFNCMFDPIDDGNTEDDFFDPTDPTARLGPSSTCFPEFVFGFQGNTRNTDFSAANTGRASHPEFADGGAGPGNGTWVRTRFDLSRFRARRVKLRFLTTSIEVGSATSWGILGLPGQGDDGWYIDDIVISDVSTGTDSGLGPDDKTPPPDTANCANKCDSVTADLTADPNFLAAPGPITELDASGSTTDRCVDGVLQYRFFADDGNNVFDGENGDILLRDWTDNPVFIDAPIVTTAYWAEVRCSSDPTCTDVSDADTGTTGDQPLVVTVTCPASLAPVIGADDKDTFSWAVSFNVDALRGNLDTLRSTGGFGTAIEQCLLDNVDATSFTDLTTPVSGSGFFYLVRANGETGCNANGWGTAKRNAEIPNDPDACP